MTAVPICCAFGGACDLAYHRGARDIDTKPGTFEVEVDERWFIAINPHREPVIGRKHKVPVPAVCIAVHYNGWPAGLIWPDGGIIAAGEGANETTFLEAVRVAILLAGGKPKPEIFGPAPTTQ